MDVAFALPQRFEVFLSVLPRPAENQDELDLARAAAAGDRDAFCQLARRHQGAVFGLCMRLLADREAAADAAQEAFARAYTALSSFDPSQRFDLWLLRIARNLCLDQLRRRGRESKDETFLATVPDQAPSAQERLEGAEATRNLEAAMESLPPEERALLALYYVQHKTTREISAVFGVAPGTIMARLFRARAKLRTRLEEA